MCEKSAVPCAAKTGTAATKAYSSAAVMRAKLLLRVIRFSFRLELPAEVESDQIRVGLVRPVEVVTADALRAAPFEVQHHLGEIDAERTFVPAHSEAERFAVGIGEERSDAFGRLRVLVINRTHPHVPVLGDFAVRAAAVGEGVLPVLRTAEAERRRRLEVDVERLEAAPGGVRDVCLDVPLAHRVRDAADRGCRIVDGGVDL